MKEAFLFVYGTLLDDDNEHAIYLKSNSGFYSAGKMRGKLFDIGKYPGAIFTRGDEFIYGSILKITNPDEVLRVLDDYEGYGADQLQPNEFVRVSVEVEVEVEIGSASIWCWVYLYNFPTYNLSQIRNGKYRR